MVRADREHGHREHRPRVPLPAGGDPVDRPGSGRRGPQRGPGGPGVVGAGAPAVGALRGIVAMYLVLKVPSALHAASTSETKMMTYAKHLEHGLHSAVTHASSAHHAPAHSAT